MIESLRIIRNARPGVDWNTCGQAVVATVLAHFRVGPFANGAPDDDGAAIDAILATHPPDMPLALGTSAFRLTAALRSHGLDADHVHSGLLGWEFPLAYDRVTRHLATGGPAIVCVDDGLLGGTPWQAHWAVLTSLDGEGAVLDGPARGRTPIAEFLAAWQCRMLPCSHNHCAVLARLR